MKRFAVTIEKNNVNRNEQVLICTEEANEADVKG